MSYPIVPGRGLNTLEAKEARIKFLNKQGINVPLIADSRLNPDEFRHTIESYIGSVEIPVGLAGPLLFNEDSGASYVFVPAATLEGALLASMSRGAKTISESGGVNTVVLHQKMSRCPMFIFKNVAECIVFKTWVEQHVPAIKEEAENYSNHAVLTHVAGSLASRSVHLHFEYTTGDASGQNMTTMCTAHAVRWILEHFRLDCNLEPVKHVIEGNGASDKKVSNYSLKNGRGLHVIAECILNESVIKRILRVNLDEFLLCLEQSRTMCSMNGMLGYNINVANTIASIFLATGQDMASVHESAIGLLNMERTDGGLYCTLHLPNLVIGTVGGGTHLFRQKEALQMMGCAGQGKAGRYAKIIAGFALALEISTFAAITGGQFAKVHEKLGRNKPVKWLLRAEINLEFIRKNLLHPYKERLESVHFLEKELVENGVIIDLTKRVNKKITGFVPFEIILKDQDGSAVHKQPVLMKCKPLDIEVYQGLHNMAASIDPMLADLISIYQEKLEFKDCHLKEMDLYHLLTQRNQLCTPRFYGSYINPSREIYTLIMELLDEQEMLLFNSETTPELWSPELIKEVIRTISNVHDLFYKRKKDIIPDYICATHPWQANPLYTRLVEIMGLEYNGSDLGDVSGHLFEFIDELEPLHQQVKVPKTIVHNDFNPRNVAIRKNGEVCIYDWELAIVNFPHRDIVEFLSFTLPIGFEEESLRDYLNYHYTLQNFNLSHSDWHFAYEYALKEYMITRVSFYMTGKIQMDYAFADRIYMNTMRMIQMLTKEKISS